MRGKGNVDHARELVDIVHSQMGIVALLRADSDTLEVGIHCGAVEWRGPFGKAMALEIGRMSNRYSPKWRRRGSTAYGRTLVCKAQIIPRVGRGIRHAPGD